MTDFRINKENKITILINIHDVELALKYCDRIIGINKGRLFMMEARKILIMKF